MLRRRALAALAPLLVAAAFAAPAGAATYCVHVAGTCAPGTIDEDADLQSALNDAASVKGLDVVEIGPGTYKDEVFYTSGDPLEIVGAGTDKTVLTQTPSGGVSEVILANADIAHLRVHVPAVPGWSGIRTMGDSVLDDVVVDAEPGAGNRTGVRLAETSTLRHSVVRMSRGTDTGVLAVPSGGDATVEDSTVEAARGIDALAPNGSRTIVHRSTVSASGVGIAAHGSPLEADNTVVRAEGAAAVGLLARCDDGQAASVLGVNLTILGVGDTGVWSQCDGTNLKASAVVADSIVRSFTHAFRRKNPGPGTADLTIVFSDLVAPTGLSEGNGSTVLSDDVGVAPDFAADGEHLAATSPLIDAAEPGLPLQPLDRDGLPRLAGERRDMGAYEVQPAPAQDLPAEWNKPPTPDPPPPPADDRPVTSSGNGTAPVTVTDAALLAGLRRTLANRHGRRYSHRFLAPGTLRIRWVARRRTIASLRIVRPQAGTAALRVRPTRFGKRLLARGHGRLRVSVRGSFARAGHPALRATRRALVRRG